MNIYEKLLNIQNELKVPKAQDNKFGGYKYRSCEDILEAVKPICKEYGAVLVLGDELKNIGERYYVEAKASLIDVEIDEGNVVHITNTAYAREEESKKGMDSSQITGTASSYARKYALNGLFNIDDTKDADTDEFVKQTQETTAPKITAEKIKILKDTQKSYKRSDEYLQKVLEKVGCKTLEELDESNWAKVGNMLGGKK